MEERSSVEGGKGSGLCGFVSLILRDPFSVLDFSSMILVAVSWIALAERRTGR